MGRWALGRRIRGSGSSCCEPPWEGSGTAARPQGGCTAASARARFAVWNGVAQVPLWCVCGGDTLVPRGLHRCIGAAGTVGLCTGEFAQVHSHSALTPCLKMGSCAASGVLTRSGARLETTDFFF